LTDDKGNLEKYERISANIHTQTPITSGPTEECPNNKVGIDQSKEYYQKFGKTKSGFQKQQQKLKGQGWWKGPRASYI